MSCFGLVLHSVGAESCLGCCGILDAKRGFAGRNFYDWLFSGILLRAFCVSEVESYQRFYAIILSVLVAL